MGYDMRFENEPDGEKERVAVANREWQVLLQIRDAFPKSLHGEYSKEEFESGGPFGNEPPANADPAYAEAWRAAHEAYNAMLAVEESYFRLNIWGMRHCREAMMEAGMAFESDYTPGYFPHGTVGVDDDGEAIHCSDVLDDWSWAPEKKPQYSEEIVQKAKEAQALVDEFLARHEPADTPGIPVHKFGSNDGWWVTPPECQAALRAYTEWRQENPSIEMPQWWGRWLKYLRGAIDHGGFRVN